MDNWTISRDYVVKPTKCVELHQNLKIITSQTSNQDSVSLQRMSGMAMVLTANSIKQTYKEMNWSLFKHPPFSRLWRPSVKKKHYLLTLCVWQTFLRQRFPWFFFPPFYPANFRSFSIFLLSIVWFCLHSVPVTNGGKMVGRQWCEVKEVKEIDTGLGSGSWKLSETISFY